MFGYNTRQNTQ